MARGGTTSEDLTKTGDRALAVHEPVDRERKLELTTDRAPKAAGKEAYRTPTRPKRSQRAAAEVFGAGVNACSRDERGPFICAPNQSLIPATYDPPYERVRLDCPSRTSSATPTWRPSLYCPIATTRHDGCALCRAHHHSLHRHCPLRVDSTASGRCDPDPKPSVSGCRHHRLHPDPRYRSCSGSGRDSPNVELIILGDNCYIIV